MSGATHNTRGIKPDSASRRRIRLDAALQRRKILAPELVRFIQPDSFTGNLAAAQRLNHFAYSLNNPLKLTDPKFFLNTSQKVYLYTICDLANTVFLFMS
jgi:hypothetical protein